MAWYPRAASAWITLDLPVPDIPVSSTRFTAASLPAPAAATSQRLRLARTRQPSLDGRWFICS
jgi:hypothetical protein